MKQYFKRLDKLYNKMDMAYHKAASHYGFACKGCGDNCCRSFFYHHTFIEKDYLFSKANKLKATDKASLQKDAMRYLKAIALENTQGAGKPLCPLNKGEQCILYGARPMICRLHGIPHHLGIPGRSINKNPGCDAGTSLFNSASYFSFDRIPFYKELAEIEREYRKKFIKSGKIKQTIAHMLIDLS